MQVVQAVVVLALPTIQTTAEVLEIPLQQLHLKVLTVVKEVAAMILQAVAVAVAEQAARQEDKLVPLWEALAVREP